VLYPAAGRPAAQVVKQRGLPHPGLTAQHEHPALACSHGVDNTVKRAAFPDPVGKPYCAPPCLVSLSSYLIHVS
jgi:hypothetical protein